MNRIAKICASACTAAAVTGGAAFALITQWEGQRHVPYLDAVGVLTVCYGHALLAADMAIARGHVNRCLPMPKLAHVEEALTSAAFNLGAQIVCGSTLQRKALANDWPGACAELSRWNRGGGRVLRGLTLRRADERALCEGRASG